MKIQSVNAGMIFKMLQKAWTWDVWVRCIIPLHIVVDTGLLYLNWGASKERSSSCIVSGY